MDSPLKPPSHKATQDFYIQLVEGEGFEPSKAEPADLQSAPFGRSGTPPKAFHSLSYLTEKLDTALKFHSQTSCMSVYTRFARSILPCLKSFR